MGIDPVSQKPSVDQRIGLCLRKVGKLEHFLFIIVQCVLRRSHSLQISGNLTILCLVLVLMINGWP